jgi:D-alanine-D-alanine ligase
MRVVIAHQAVDSAAPPEERDVLLQVEHVAAALQQLGHQTSVVPCTLDLQSVSDRLDELRPHVVFNLVESLGNTDGLAVLVPLLLESRGIPYTGCPATALLATNDKLAAKRRFRSAGLPTPAWFSTQQCLADGLSFPERFIVKCTAEHASLGLDDSAVQWAASLAQLQTALAARQDRLGRPCFAEQFIDGREFNLSLLQRPEGPQLLPPAEISFAQLPAGKPCIVGYNAKWSDSSLEYRATPRRYHFPAADAPLLCRLQELALRCWEVFGLRGYARVDFRVDTAGRPWLLEVNANPCLSPDAGFAFAAQRAGLTFTNVVDHIVQVALHDRHTRHDLGPA